MSAREAEGHLTFPVTEQGNSQKPRNNISTSKRKFKKYHLIRT